MIVAIMQPTFNPWLGYFDMIDKVDSFVLYDDVQLSKRSWQTKNRIKSPNGEVFLNIPIKKTSSRDETLIMDAQIDWKQNWKSKHLKSLALFYKKSNYFDEVYDCINDLYSIEFKGLAEFNINIIEALSHKISLPTRFIKSSELSEVSGTKDVRLLSICEKIGCTEYLSPKGSADYIEVDYPGGALGKKGIKVLYHNYQHPVYPQEWGAFMPYLGIFDLVFNVGFSEALEVIRQGRKEDLTSIQLRKG